MYGPANILSWQAHAPANVQERQAHGPANIMSRHMELVLSEDSHKLGEHSREYNFIRIAFSRQAQQFAGLSFLCYKCMILPIS